MGTLRDITGEKFGKLTVIERAGSSEHGYSLWKCECECGNRIIAIGTRLVNAKLRSCGCLRKEKSAERGRASRKSFVYENGTKNCISCGGIKSVLEFYISKNNSSGLSSECKLCKWIKRIQRDYKLSLDNYLKILENQNNVCPICGSDKWDPPGKTLLSPNIDHDHSTGEVRGILHNWCNRIPLPFVENKYNIVEGCIRYLEKFKKMNVWKYLRLAQKAARREREDPRCHTHGSIAIRSDGAIVFSRNGYSQQKFPKSHAEQRILRKCDWDSIVFVVRNRKNGEFGLSRPCPMCDAAMRVRGVKRVYYSINDSEYGVIDYGV